MENLQLETVIGITASSPFSLASSLEGENKVFYAAGATLVAYNHKTNKQETIGNSDKNDKNTTSLSNEKSGSLKNSTPKTITCLHISKDGKYLAIGQAGHQPKILIYDVNQSKLTSSLTGHKYGVLAAQFSPDSKYLVSVGVNHDGAIFVWDWKTSRKLCGAKLSVPLFSIAFDPASNFFVTVGVKHIRFWDLEKIKRASTSSNIESSSVLDGKPGALGEHSNASLVDVACGLYRLPSGKDVTLTYAVTLEGHLLLFNENRILEKWLHAKMEKGSCVLVNEKYVICGGSGGKIRFFEPSTLKHLGNITSPEPLLSTFPEHKGDEPLPRVFPQVISFQYTKDDKLIAVYSNMTLAVFDAQNLKKVTVLRLIKHHADCIWGVLPITTISGIDSSKENEGFMTYSSDGFVRFWESSSFENPLTFTTLLADPKGAMKFQFFNRFGSSNDIKSVTERTGIRSLAIDPLKKLIACGDRNGTIGIFRFEDFEKIATIEAHDAEIMALDFVMTGPNDSLILASASRDRLIHIFDATQSDGKYDFQLVQTLDDHSSTLTAMMFADSGSKLISCGADKTIIFRSLQDDGQVPHFATYRNTPLRSTVYDMGLAQVSRTIITASQDRRITVLDIDSGKPNQSFATNILPIDSTIKANPFLNTLTTDPTGSIICAGASDKTVHLIDSQTGNSIGFGIGHGDLITDVAFINQGTHIASTSADGCIFIWKVPETVIRKMGYLPKITPIQLPSSNKGEAPTSASQPSPSVFQFDEAHLPTWARQESDILKDQLNQVPSIPAAQGRWAERSEKVTLYSEIPPSPVEKQIEASSLEGKELSALEGPMNTSMLDISIHVSSITDSEMSMTMDESERIVHDPFADSIETDSEDALDEYNFDPEDKLPDNFLISREGRNTLSSAHFSKQPSTTASSPTKTIHASTVSSPISLKSSIKPLNETPTRLRDESVDSLSKLVQPTIGASPSPQQVPNKTVADIPESITLVQGGSSTKLKLVSAHDLDLFEKLAEKTANSILVMKDSGTVESLEKVHRIISAALGKDDLESILEKYSERIVQLVQEKLKRHP